VFNTIFQKPRNIREKKFYAIALSRLLSGLISYTNHDIIQVLTNDSEVLFLPAIRPSADLRNKYNEISELCHKYEEPVFITKNGKGDLAVLSIETYEKLCGRAELYRLLEEGLEDEKAGRVRPFREAIADIRK
jgi:prevent-host-death family protein